MAAPAPLRAPGHRAFLAPEFGGALDEFDEPAGLTYLQVMADPKLAYLGRQVWDQLRGQFGGDPAGVGEETEADEAYRLKLEGWADALEILLEEVLEELASLRGGVGRGEEAAP